MSLSARLRLRRGELDVCVDLEVAPGQTAALLGPNGAGKTTCLRALAGLERLRGGRVVLDGRVLEDAESGAWVPPERRDTCVVFQPLTLLPHLDARDNVAFGARARGASAEQARITAAEWLARLGVERCARSLPAALSGGEAQRVALAQAMAPRPRMLLLDEPLGSVDASARVEMRALLRGVLAAHDGVRLLVTHDPLEAAELADVVVVIDGGRVVQQGTIAEVTARPRSSWVARMVHGGGPAVECGG